MSESHDVVQQQPGRGRGRPPLDSAAGPKDGSQRSRETRIRVAVENELLARDWLSLVEVTAHNSPELAATLLTSGGSCEAAKRILGAAFQPLYDRINAIIEMAGKPLA